MAKTTKSKKLRVGSGEENWSPNRANRKSSSSSKKRPSPNSNLSDDDDSDDDDRNVFRWKRQKTTAKKSPKAKSSTVMALPEIEPLPTPTETEKQAILETISSELDRNLQIVLWEIDCNYTLLPHQFLGVRALAGLSDDFPGKLKFKSKDESMSAEDIVFESVCRALEKAKPRRENDRGVLMADVMGLGKTVQAVVACILRNAIARTRNEPKKPTLICSPNDAVLAQWHETLIAAGVPQNKIYRYKTKTFGQPLKGERYYLLNRYDLQTDTKHVFTMLRRDQAAFPRSPLFPNAKKNLLLVLKNQYQAEQGKASNMFKAKDERITTSEIVTKFFKKSKDTTENHFITVIIDEAHFLKNLTAFWGMAAALIGIHAERMIPMSGTPYNNNCQDLATLMCMICPSLDSANEKWWKNATKDTSAARVRDATAEWSTRFLIRREKSVIANHLPKKIIHKKHVAPYPLELSVYEHYEAKFLTILKKFKRLERNPNLWERQIMRQYFEMMLAFASSMRCSLVHPLLAGGGRDVTVLFSPTRSKMQSVLSSQEKPNRCVCCQRRKNKKKAVKKTPDTFDNLDDEDCKDEDESLADFIVDDDDEIEYEDDFVEDEDEDRAKEAGKEDMEEERQEARGGHSGIEKGTGEIVKIPSSLCPLSAHGISHFACQSCLEFLDKCPCCVTAMERLRLETARNALMKKHMESSVDTKPEDMEIPRARYCTHILGGFVATAKLESIVEDFKQVPSNEKVLIASFFKGSLDLLEAIFHELNIETARFDGDIGAEEREVELKRFKTKDSCRVLLMTVQTGGTGLNLVEASRVFFVDRFWNPMVMEQAEDRCYRFGQKKDVHVTYHDVSYTTDDVMRHINEAKSENAQIILANGIELSAATNGMSFKDISGSLGNSVRAIRDARINLLQANKHHFRQPLPPSPQGILDSIETTMSQLAQFSSTIEVIASMLGYAPPPSVPPARTPRSSPKPETASSEMKVKPTVPPGSTPRASSDTKAPARTTQTRSEPQTLETKSNSADCNDASDVKNESGVVITPVQEVEPAVAEPMPSETDGEETPKGAQSWLEDSSEEDNIPGAVVFKSSKK